MTSFEPAADLAVVADHLEAVTIHRAGSSSVENVPLALRAVLGERQSTTGGGQTAVSDVVWHLPQASLSRALRLGDVIVAGQERWTILAIEHKTLGGRLRCSCRNLAIAFGLTDLVRIQRAEWVKGVAGAQTPVWRDDQLGIAARVVLDRVDAIEPEQEFLLRQRFKIYLADHAEIADGQRIVDQDERAYRIIGYERADGFETPSVVTAVASVVS